MFPLVYQTHLPYSYPFSNMFRLILCHAPQPFITFQHC